MKLGLGLGLTRGQCAQTSPPLTPITILIVGDSVGGTMFNDSNFLDPTAGLTAFQNELLFYFSSVTVLNGCKTGIAVMHESDSGQGAYLDIDEVSKSANYISCINNTVTNAGLTGADIDFVLQIQGNEDATNMEDGSPTVPQMKAGLQAFWDLIRADFPNATYGMIPLGADTDNYAFTGWRYYIDAACQFRLESNDVYEFPSYILGPYRDDMHLTEEASIDFWPRAAKRIAAVMGVHETTGTLGPIVSGMEFDVADNIIYLTLDHDGVTDFDISNNGKQFSYDINGTIYPAYFTLKENGKIRTRPKNYTIQSGDVVQVFSMASTFKNTTTIDLCRDTNGYALRPNSDIIATVQ